MINVHGAPIADADVAGIVDYLAMTYLPPRGPSSPDWPQKSVGIDESS
jgi:hypothetical protein